MNIPYGSMKLRYPQEGGHEYSASEYNVIRILNVRCGHRTLRFVIIKVYSVWVDVLRQSSIKAHSVGVDDHIDPRTFAKSLKLMTLPIVEAERNVNFIIQL